MFQAESRIVFAPPPWVWTTFRKPLDTISVSPYSMLSASSASLASSARLRNLGSGFFTNVKYAPSVGSNIWLLTPIVVPPPPWDVLIVLLALV